MARLNKSHGAGVATHEFAPAPVLSPEQSLRRTVMACLLWERGFYESGMEVAVRISSLVPAVDPEKVRDIAVEARRDMNLRHAPLLIARAMVLSERHRPLVAETLEKIIQRPDELSEFLAIYWKDGRVPLAAQVKKGLARAFAKFDEYQLSKYNGKAAIRLRDVMFLVHPKPADKAQEEMWKRLVAGELKPADTWERALSSGEDKKEAWERLLSSRKLGAMALIRNLRNMIEAGVDRELINSSILGMNTEKVLPFRFLSAAAQAEEFAPALEKAMFKSLEGFERLGGRTVLMVDVSGSMFSYLSGASVASRFDAANGLAVMLREICEDVRIFTFSADLVGVEPLRGFELVKAIASSQFAGSTFLGKAVQILNNTEEYDRLVVITDEQSGDSVPAPKARGYMINVASNKNGVGYGDWVHIDGWSESVVRFVSEYERTI